MTPEKRAEVVKKALAMYEKAHIILTQKEKESIEIADFALDDFDKVGLIIVTYVNTSLCCAKEMVLLPMQTCPEHTHKPLPGGYIGKEETFRCRFGKVYLHVQGEPTENAAAKPPLVGGEYYTAAKEIVLLPGEQYTLKPDTLHWFQAGVEGAVISEFSTPSHDEFDIFTDPGIIRN